MEIFQIVGLALVATIFSVLLRNDKPELAIQIGIVTGAAIFLLMIFKISAVVTLLQEIAKKVNLDTVYLTTVLKIIGIAYITTFGAEVCRDAGESAIAAKVEFAGKIMIMVLTVPILMAVLDIMLGIIP
jgi:stage III sporulation protein AD